MKHVVHPRRASTLVIDDELCFDYTPRDLGDEKPWYCYHTFGNPYRVSTTTVLSHPSATQTAVDGCVAAFRTAHPHFAES